VRLLGFCVREAAAGLWRQRGATLLSVLVITVALGVFGSLLAVTHNVRQLMAGWASAAEFSVYLRDDITPEQRSAVNRLLAESDLVASRTYVSKTDAVARFQRDFPDLAASIAGLEVNPLPASIDVRLTGKGTATDAVESLATRARIAPGVADVRFDRQWLARLAAIVSAITWAGSVLGLALAVAAVLTVATVVRLSLHARRDEVDILQLMGAPVLLLRGPLVVEGLLHGALGGSLALAGIYGGFAAMRHAASLSVPALVDAGVLANLPLSLALALAVGGAVVGCVGGLTAAREVR
jgi:cell division transport system permease protein